MLSDFLYFCFPIAGKQGVLGFWGVRGAAAAAYAEVFEAMAECGSLDYMIKAEAPSTAAAAADEEEEDDPNREIAWWCIPPDSDMARGKDTLLSLVGQSHIARLPRQSSV